ncbi:glycosyltransferase family 2 protein [Chloroflexota bacterium]
MNFPHSQDIQESTTVTIAILNWNNCDLLQKSVESVKAQTYPHIRILFLDNASSDDSVCYIRDHYPEIPIKVFPKNIGFSKAHNWGIRNSQDHCYMPLNPDVSLDPDFVFNMVKVLDENKKIGAVAGKLYFLQGQSEYKSYIIYSTGHLLTKSRAPVNRGYKKADNGQYNIQEEIFAANGAAPLYRRKMLEDITLNGEYFCDDFFIYGDDHDLGWRAQLRGWKCVYCPRAIGYHIGFGSGGMQSFFVKVQFSRNRFLTLVRNDSLRDLIFDLPYFFSYELILNAYWLIRTPKRVVAHWIGIVQAIISIPKTLKARKQIMASRKVTHQYIRSFFVTQLF